MKKVLNTIFSKRNNALLLLVLSSSIAMAEEYQFKFTLGNQTWKHAVSASSKNSALEIASQDCLSHFTNSSGQQKIKVTEEIANDLLDTCTNPR